MILAKEIFTRYELKHVVDSKTYTQLLRALEPYTKKDAHGDKDGRYTISSLYYDTITDSFHHERMFGQNFRQKLRLRVYNDTSLDGKAFLEIKKKHKKLVNKRRTLMKLGDVYDFVASRQALGDDLPFEVSNPQILREIDFFKNLYRLEPRLIVSYERQAFQTINDEEIRITFDSNLRNRRYDLRLEGGSYGETYLDPDFYVLEVKLMGRMPLWLTRILSEHRCGIQPFSKYSNSFYTDLMMAEKKKIL